MRKFGLGRGLESLIPKRDNKLTPKLQDSVFYIELSKIVPNINQPRKDFDQSSLVELADSIKKYGVLQPILVSKIEKPSDYGMDVEYEIVAGEKRWGASRIAGLPNIPVIIKDNCDKQKIRLEVALIENLQREDLNPLDEAQAYSRLIKEFGLMQKEVAAKVGKSREYVANSIRLMNLPAEAKEAVRSGKISRTQARVLLAFSDANTQKQMLKKIMSGAAVVRDLESSAKEAKLGNSPSSKVNKRFLELERNLAKNVGSPVMIKSGANGGSIVIRFATLEDLNKIVEIILK